MIAHKRLYATICISFKTFSPMIAPHVLRNGCCWCRRPLDYHISFYPAYVKIQELDTMAAGIMIIEGDIVKFLMECIWLWRAVCGLSYMRFIFSIKFVFYLQHWSFHSRGRKLVFRWILIITIYKLKGAAGCRWMVCFLWKHVYF